MNTMQSEILFKIKNKIMLMFLLFFITDKIALETDCTEIVNAWFFFEELFTKKIIIWGKR